jgi:hypothetical protein
VDVIEFQTTEAYSNQGLTRAKYSTNRQSKEEKLKVIERNRQSKEEKLKVTERMRPRSFMHSENRKSTWL